MIKQDNKRIEFNYRQYRAMRRLMRECCNYEEGNCILLERGHMRLCPEY